jgi:hypothetical protein
MKKQQQGISNAVLETELRVAMMQIDQHNYGYARQTLEQIHRRVMTYLLKKEATNEKTS